MYLVSESLFKPLWLEQKRLFLCFFLFSLNRRQREIPATKRIMYNPFCNKCPLYVGIAGLKFNARKMEIRLKCSMFSLEENLMGRTEKKKIFFSLSL